MLRLIRSIAFLCMLPSARMGEVYAAGGGTSARPCDPLQNSHIVFRGTVTSIDEKHFTLAEWGLVTPAEHVAKVQIPVSMVHLQVAEVLRGMSPRNEIVVAVRDQPWLLETGKEYIICALWYSPPVGGVFVTEPGIGFYVSGPYGWTKCGSSGGQPAEVLTRSAIDSRVHAADIDHVTESADVIARGTITRTWESKYEAEGHTGVLLHYEMRPHEILKGKVVGDAIQFVAPSPNGTFVPESFRCIPFGIAAGQEWFVFLREGQFGLFPFGGPNSLLEVKGDNLIFDMSVQYPVGVKELHEIVRSKVPAANN